MVHKIDDDDDEDDDVMWMDGLLNPDGNGSEGCLMMARESIEVIGMSNVRVMNLVNGDESMIRMEMEEGIDDDQIFVLGVFGASRLQGSGLGAWGLGLGSQVSGLKPQGLCRQLRLSVGLG